MAAHSKPLKAKPPYPTFRFATSLLNPNDRIEAWRELFGRAICSADIEPLDDAEFSSDITLRVLPGLGLASGTCSGALYARKGKLLSNDDLIFVVNHAGNDLAHMLGREAVVKNGEAVLVAMDAACSVVNRTSTRFTTMRIPRAAIAEAIPELEAAMVKPIAADDPSLQLLLNYISVLEDGDAVTTSEQRETVVANLYDLIAVSVGATGDHLERAKHRGIAAARLRAIKTDIRSRLPGGETDLMKLAARHNVTPRYIQLLFEQSGETYSGFVLFERLAASHRLLRDPGNDNRSIADIALGVGFNDVSYFNRSFRKQFDKTPSELRASVG